MDKAQKLAAGFTKHSLSATEQEVASISRQAIAACCTVLGLVARAGAIIFPHLAALLVSAAEICDNFHDEDGEGYGGRSGTSNRASRSWRGWLISAFLFACHGCLNLSGANETLHHNKWPQVSPGLFAPGDIAAQDGILAVFTNRAGLRTSTGKTKSLYPKGELAAHIVGFRARNMTGAAGIEASLDLILHWPPDQATTNLRPCRTVLTLRCDCQRILEEEIRAAGIKHQTVASAIVIEPKTGRILALGQHPSYDPSHPARVPPEFWRIRAVSDVHEPGAALRFILLAAALSEGKASANTRIDCENGSFKLEGHWIRDSNPRGILSLEEVMAQPSSIGLAKLGQLVKPERLYGYLTNFGLGNKTGIPLEAESRGILRPYQSWDKVTASRISLGYGYAVTQLQTVLALTVIANQGVYVNPVLIDRLETDSGQVVWSASSQRRSVISPTMAKETGRILQKVCASGGSASRVYIPGTSVAGCQGTALQVNRSGYVTGHYYAQFVGYCPADQPAICVGVALAQPTVKDGERVTEFAAPVFERIARRMLNILSNRSR